MKTRKLYTGLLLAMLGLASLLACGKDTESGHDHQSMQNRTRMVKLDGVQVAFDLMSMDSHKQMMQMMKLETMQHADKNHHLSITLMSLETRKPIGDAQDIRISITLPDGQTVSGPAQTMSGGGMHHYGLDFDLAGTGTYQASVAFKHKGQSLQAKTSFEI